MKKIWLYSIIPLLFVITLSIGYSALKRDLVLKRMTAQVRLEIDTRITGVSVVSEETSTNVVSTNDYNRTSLLSDLVLPTEDSYITYEVEISNFGEERAGLYNIENIPDNLEIKEITNYKLKEAICDSNEKCTLGARRKIKLKIGYKTGQYDANKTTISMNLKFNFSKMVNVTYKGMDRTNLPHEAMKGYPFTVKLSLSSIKITMNGVELTESEYTYNNGTLVINNVDGDIIIENDVTKYTNGEIIYYDVKKGQVCTNYHEDNSKTGYNGIDTTTSNQNSCLKFYAFNDDGGNRVKLILDHNTTAKITWSMDISSPTMLLDQLKTDTDSWNGTETPENYTLDQSFQTSGVKYTIDYSGYKARIITANEIAQITGNTNWDESTASSYFYFDSNTGTVSTTCKSGNITGCKYGWLYDRTNTRCKEYGCLNNSVNNNFSYGYWTATACANSTTDAWKVGYTGIVDNYSVGDMELFGIRPVIEVLRDNLISYKTYENGEIVYFNVDTGSKCIDYTEKQSNTGIKSGCMKFYAFNDEGSSSNKISLILDHNTTAAITINSSGSTTSSPKELLTQLKTDTDSWKGTITPENYTLDQSSQTSKVKYTIDYSGYKARLITANEIAKITGNTNWDESIAGYDNEFYLDTNTATASTTCTKGNITGCKYGWLYDNTVYINLGDDDTELISCEEYGGTITDDNKNYLEFFTTAYWTSSFANTDSKFIWAVGYRGWIYLADPFLARIPGKGIRPVITISKSKLS